MGKAVCQNCWTWYTNGEAVCKTCRIPLMPADVGAPAFSAGSASAASSAGAATPGLGATGSATAMPIAPAGFNWMRLLPIGGIVAIAVIAFAVIASLNLGGPATASDGSFSVQAPSGWYPTTWSLVNGTKVVLSLEKLHNGVKSNFAAADFGQQVPLSRLPAVWGQMQVEVANGQFNGMSHLGALNTASVAGAPAAYAEVDGTDGSGQLWFVNYGNTSYIVVFVSTTGHFSEMRDTDFAQILSTWKWLK